MINNVVLVGRLTKDPELRYTSSGTANATVTLAVNRQFTNQKGEKEADFINCVVWRKTAESLANYTSKGSLVGIEGRIQTRSYDNQQGQRVYVTEVVAEVISFLDAKNSQKTTDTERQAPAQTNTQNYNSNQTSSNYSRPETKPYSKDGVAQHDISDDDLPF
ncbi:single-stranded DNA-binding protein [Carnobacterium pleistocenium]|uniref:single-stranded DNA-binding protein n=1 Tax=Carnobacterium pleistocenium TaxID=181073 RepID=UPI000555822F|nr:single-stranded DNA-binding protein [Carnobacterium pleistocenium]